MNRTVKIWRVMKLLNFEGSQIFKNISWKINMNMKISELMSLPHNISFILYTEIMKISYFSDENITPVWIPLLIDAIKSQLQYILIWQTDICDYVLAKNEKFQNLMYKIYGELWGNDIINSLIYIFILMFQEMFSENLRTFKI